ncbi:hypothetical protein [uncultured Anaerotruncus sp.]|uniref:hypothetical protein n=1 Tax=uncultured Anaerotruncus sp. TaxID=905011 RepID=UPI0026707B82|nr:hypothetical protein [uncultured Anaerotruncus sp.]
MTEREIQSRLSGYAGKIIEQAAELPLEDQERLLLIARGMAFTRNLMRTAPDGSAPSGKSA